MLGIEMLSLYAATAQPTRHLQYKRKPRIGRFPHQYCVQAPRLGMHMGTASIARLLAAAAALYCNMTAQRPSANSSEQESWCLISREYF